MVPLAMALIDPVLEFQNSTLNISETTEIEP